VCDRAHIAFRPVVPNRGLTRSLLGGLWRMNVGGDDGLGTMQYLLILLVAVTMACGAAAGVTIVLVPAYADDSAKGY
jgi:hypothetical protein